MDAGYAQEKYAIKFRGHKLLDWSLASLANFRDSQLVLIAREHPGIREVLRKSAGDLGFPSHELVIIDRPTRGQAETACLAEPVFDVDESILIFNTDTFIDPSAISPAQIRGDGWIPTFRAPGEQWSFVQVQPDGEAIRTTEKERISEHCSVGLYYFSSFHGFRELVARSKWERELYVAPLYNEWIEAGHKTYISELPDSAVTVLGTPEDLKSAAARNRPNWPESCR
jgi:GTP:adenosylcobinamide-phosphate guanylyltransferase